MRFIYLAARNFGSYQDLYFPFTEGGSLALITGENKGSTFSDSNGAGKSQIPESLSWCLYGKTIRGEDYDGIVRKDSDGFCVVVVELKDDDGTAIIVARSRGAGKMDLPPGTIKGNSLRVWVAGEDISRPTMADTQTVIDSILGCDFLTFSNSILFPEGEGVNFFAALTDSSQKAILEKIFGLEKLTEYQAEAKVRLNVAQAHSNAAISDIKAMETSLELAADRLTQEEVMLNSWGDKTQEKLSLLDRDAVKTDELILNNTKAMLEFEKSVPDGSNIKERRAEAAAKLLRYQKKLMECSVNDTNFIRQIDEQNDKIKKLENKKVNVGKVKGEATCPVCGQELSEGTIDIHIKEIDEEIGRIKHNITLINLQLEKNQKQLKTAMNKKDKAQQVIDEVEKLSGEINDAERKRGVFKLEAERLKATLDGIEKTRKDLLTAENPYEENCLSMQKSVKRKTHLLSEMNTRINDEIMEIKKLQFLVQAFGNHGIKSFVLDSVIPAINDRLDEYSMALTDGTISVQFSTQSKLKSGEVSDDFNVLVDNSNGSTTYKSLSKGERRRVNLMIVMALRAAVQGRATKKFNLLFADEVFDALDSIGIDRTIQLLNRESEGGCAVYVISHNPDMQFQFNNIINVVKEAGISSLGVDIPGGLFSQ